MALLMFTVLLLLLLLGLLSCLLEPPKRKHLGSQPWETELKGWEK